MLVAPIMTRMDHDAEFKEIAARIVSEYAGLLSLMRRRVGAELAAELVNEAIVIALGQRKAGRPLSVEHVGGYLYKTSMNLLRNYQRKMSNRLDLHVVSDDLPSDAEKGANEAIADAFIQQQVMQVIESLSTSRDRLLVTRYYLDGAPREVICREFQLSAQTFSTIVFRARQKMRALLESNGLSKNDFFCL